MGKRCRLAAWGATFALFVAACTATEAPTSSRPAAEASRPASTSQSSIPTAVTFPHSLADASFVHAALPDGPCAAGDNAHISVFDSANGDETWSFPIPRPSNTSIIDGSVAYVSFRWDRGQHPGVGAIDLAGQAPLWQRFLTSEAEQMAVTDAGLIVVTRDDVRAIDIETGEDLWVNNSQFDFSRVALADDAAFAIDRVGVHAIDYSTGAVMWRLEVERPDAVAARGKTMAVAAGTRLIAVDTSRQGRLFDVQVNRLGAGQIWVTPTAISFELSPNTAPGGGVASLDRNSGVEKWRATGIGEAQWVGDRQLIASTASGEPAPAQPFALFALDATTGEEIWRVPATAQAFESVLGTSSDRLVTIDPHPAVSGLHRIRVIDAPTGELIWETSSDSTFDGAVVEAGTFVTAYASSSSLSTDRGRVSMLLGADSPWEVTRSDGIAQAPLLTPHGLVVISGERTPTCVGRALGEPVGQSQVLGATAIND
ncbi:MAG: outer membrane protein assembly factor BamB [Verrucomicrobiales bacterium]|jgi:outer membrane protein assembly factor BamB